MRNVFYLVVVASTVLACGSSNETQSDAGAGSGGDSLGGSSATGAQSSGGSAASNTGGAAAGGATPTGGSSTVSGGAGGMAASGGMGSGGTAASGGTNTGGTAASGATDTGGTGPAGGTTTSAGSGGRQASGGRTGSGTGGRSMGGASSGGTAGETSGGAAGRGGGSATGGETGSGGAEPTGGTGGGGAPACEVPTGSPGEPIVFNDNGGWCWYQDERAIVDVEANKLVIGSVAIGGSRGGHQEIVTYDLAAGTKSQPATIGSNLSPDDHNTPGIIQVSAGKYLAVYTGHNQDCYSYYNIYNNGSWGGQQRFDWGPIGCPTSDNRTISYTNLWQMPGRIFNFVRSVETSPNLITTTDGSSFTYVGRLSKTRQVGYVAGYYKYWGNNVDRIDFVGTEAHPRDNDNSLYHGYVKATESSITSYDSMGTQKGTIDQASKSNAPDVTEFTKIFATGTTINGVRLEHMWNHDIMRYDDGTIVVLGQGRVTGTGSTDPDKRFIYLRFDGSKWSATYLVKGGAKLYNDEQDYTGLSAVHPNNPYTIYVSTAYDPRDDTTKSAKREIWRGTTCDQGKSFTWTPITQNSSEDNIRPIVPYWPGNKTALLWMRGDYRTAQTYQTKVVGLIMDGP